MNKRKSLDEKTKRQTSSHTKATSTVHRVSTGTVSNNSGSDRLNLKIDTAFKFIFMQEEFMISFLNSLLELESPIVSLTYNNTEKIPEFSENVKVVFDLECTTSNNEHIVVEMQYSWHEHFMERALYYVSRKISEQLKVPKTDEEKEKMRDKDSRYQLQPVYGIFLMDFHLESERPTLLRDLVLTDQQNGNETYMTHLMHMYFVELPCLTSEDECNTLFKQWIYCIENNERMKENPFLKKNPVFEALEQKAFEHQLSDRERAIYEREKKYYWTALAVMDSKYNLGKKDAEAKAYQEKLESARRFKEMGLSNEQIAHGTGLPISEIENI